jgi:hypothetical protein
VLDEAANLISSILADSPNSAQAYLQAARITVNGGRIVQNIFEPGTLNLYDKLIDRALGIEPNNIVESR